MAEDVAFFESSVNALVAPVEKRHGAGTGVAADDGANIVDEHLAVEMGEALLNQAATACASSRQAEWDM